MQKIAEELKKHLIATPHFHMARIMLQDQPDPEKRIIPMTFTSTGLIQKWWGVYRIDHSAGAMDTRYSAQGLPFLDSHDTTRQGGRIENYRAMGDANTGGDVRFAKTPLGDELYALHSDGIRQEVSIGFQILGLDQVDPEEMDDEMKQACLENQCPGFNVTKWMPVEGSSVSIPADPTVGHNLDYYDNVAVFQMLRERNFSKLNDLIPDAFKPGAGKSIHIIHTKEHTMEQQDKNPAAPAPDNKLSDVEKQQILQDERTRVEQIRKYGKKFVGRVENIDELIEQAEKDAKMDFAKFKGIVADSISDSEPVETPASALGLSERETKQFSLVRLIHAAALQASGHKDPWKEAGFELELSNAVAQQIDYGKDAAKVSRSPKAVQVFIPYEVQERKIRVERQILELGKRLGLIRQDMTVGSPTGGGNLKATNLLPGEFIDLPRNMTLMERLGARVLNGLQGDYVIPKQTGAGSFGWITTEGNDAGETAPTVGTVSLSPKIGGAFTDYTYKLLLQATPAIEALVQADLQAITDLGVDLASFHGTAANGQPRGLVNQSGIGTFSGANLALEAIIEAITDVMTANLLSGSLAWATNPTGWGLTQLRERWLSTGKPLAESGVSMNGYPLAVSNQIAAGHLFFGDFTQVILGNWGGQSLLVDPYTGGASGTTRVRVLVATDVAVRNANAFSVATDVS